MVRALSLLLSVLLVSLSSLVHARRGLFPRAVTFDLDECYGSDWQSDVTTRFTGIFFGDFTTGGGTDILGGLAVQGNLQAPDYVVNANHVHGSAYLNLGGTVDQVKEQEPGCHVTDQAGTGLFDFNTVRELAIASSMDFASLAPTALLHPDGTITYTRNNNLFLYEALSFHSCAGQVCSHHPLLESDPDEILFGKGNWNGVQGSDIDPLKTYVMNIPVLNGDTIEINGNNPSLGFNPCKLIYNFYPVDQFGTFLPEGEFTLIRRTASQFGGFTLAPRGHIIDGSVGNFAGNIVGMDYTWENLNAGVEIHDYHAAGGDCDYYEGCVPVHIDPPTISISLPIYTFSSTPVVPTDSLITWSRPIIHISTFDSCTVDITDTETLTDTVTETATVTIASSTNTVTETIASFTETESFTETDLMTKTLVIIKPTTIVVTVTSCASSTKTLTEVVVESCTSAAQTVTETVIDCDYHTHHHHHHKDDHKGHDHGPDEECNEEEEEDQKDDYKHKKVGKDDDDDDEDEDEDEE
ncbi:hypothetical protein [Parasitella parasitica]|uniref:Choice-of-anchor A domain-containing protein n=1 Tax=Parasitella parasitica TaxID=35722 RepID=A0A0B7N003_9FUNG|nr:hypothetical protein [Parasitella parasitica]